MHFSPLLHGSAGILDEIILVAEAVLVLALLVTFLKSRTRRKTNPPADTQPPESK